MDFNSYEIDRILYQKQMRLYQRIDDLINKQFDALEADKLAVLTRTMKDLELSIQLYKKDYKMVNCLVLLIIVTESQSMRVHHYWKYILVYKRKTPNT